MGLFQYFPKIFGLNEDLQIQKATSSQESKHTEEFYNVINQKQNLSNFLSNIRKLGSDRDQRYRDYENLLKDSTVITAISMMADDATQLDIESNKSYWIHSDDTNLAKELNEYLDMIKLENRVWKWAFAIAGYGEIFLRTFETDPVVETKGMYLEECDFTENIYELVAYGETVGYYEKPESSKKNSDGKFYTPKEFIHIYSDKQLNRSHIKLKVPNGNGDEKEVKYRVRFGSSLLDGVRQAYNILKVMEDIMVLSRLSRSSLLRLFKINVGSAGKTDTVRMINEVKNALKSKESLALNNGHYKNNLDPLPMNDNVYIPVRQNKGDVTVEELGGNVDVKALLDLDYFFNKFAGSLKIPKSYLGWEESIPGGLGNTSWVRLDIRYCRTIKSIVRTIKEGVKAVCDYYLESSGKGNQIGKYEVKSTPLNDAEESDRVQDILNRSQAAESIATLITMLEDRKQDSKDFDFDILYKFVFNSILGVEYNPAVKKPKSTSEPSDLEDKKTKKMIKG
jgi:hypothetical protein